MANKRIELEQYRCYVNLFDEEPNRKKARRGAVIALTSAALLVALFFVLGLLSGNLASNPKNILEKPPAPAPEGGETMPGVTIPGQEGGFPTNINIPGQEGGLPTDVSIPVEGEGGLPTDVSIPFDGQGAEPGPVPGEPGSTLDQGGASAVLTDFDPRPNPPAAAGALLAQAVPLEPPAGDDAGAPVPLETAPGTDTTVPFDPTGAVPVEGDVESGEEKDSGPPAETSGVGNLSNLAELLNGRGFQLYLLVLLVVLGVIIYLTLRRAYREGGAR